MSRPFCLLALVPLLMGAKCIDYDARFAGPREVDGGPAAAGTPCSNPSQALLRIENYSFQIQCGCAEASGKVCTVEPGTTVRWTFADTTEHNIASLAGAFGRSGDRLAGVFEHTFGAAGSYKYGCSIHPSDMSGYRVEVRAAAPDAGTSASEKL
jgi:plastocyanin